MDFTGLLQSGYDQIADICGVPNAADPFVDNTSPPEDDDDTKTFLEYFEDNVKVIGKEIFMTQPMGNEKVMTWTYSDVLEQAKQVAGYLESLKLKSKSQIAIMSKNCAWWIIADLGIWMAGHVSVPVYPTLTADTTRYILKHSEAKLLFVGKLDEKPWLEMKEGIPESLPTISFPLSPENSAKSTWESTISGHAPITKPVKPDIESMATIIYTSGSTGKPKGVMTSFKAMTTATKGIVKELNITSKDRYMSYLPVSHGMERWCGECVPLYSGEQLFFAESIKTFADDLNRAKPTLFLSVPRLWTKFQAKVFQKLPEDKLDLLLKIPVLNFLLRKKLLSAMGLDCVRVAGSGSAPIPAELLQWYKDLGLNILEGYGMTENFNYSHFSTPGTALPGFVGVPYGDVECRIAEDGEIQVKTPGKMMGYFKNINATRDAFTSDGWVRTGDKGTIDEEGRLKITGRTKEIFKTSKGKYVAPAPIENKFVANSLVELACVGGRGHPQPHVILQLAEAEKIAVKEDKSKMEEIGSALQQYLEKVVNPSLDQHEQLDFIVIVGDEWVPENGFLTPTQKIKRSKIEEEYNPSLDGWYGLKKKIIWHSWE